MQELSYRLVFYKYYSHAQTSKQQGRSLFQQKQSEDLSENILKR